MPTDLLIPAHGGYRKLLSYQVAQLVYDVTVRFCDRYVSRFSRTKEQMIQAARSGVRNIVEGSQNSGISKKSELKLTGIARGSLEELKGDYEDYLRHNGYLIWAADDPRRRELIGRRPRTADEVAAWVKETALRVAAAKASEHDGHNGPPPQRSKHDAYAETSANAALTLVIVANSLIGRQLRALERAFMEKGGFTEALYTYRKDKRRRDRH